MSTIDTLGSGATPINFAEIFAGKGLGTQEFSDALTELLVGTGLFTNTVDGLNASPALEAPKTPIIRAAGSSLDSLLESLQFTERKQAVRDGLNSIEARKEERAEAFAEKIKQIQDNLNKSVLEKVGDAFKYIGMIIGAIASMATIVTGNAPMAIGGAIMLIMTINSIVADATEGEHGISAWVGDIAMACGASEEEAKKWGMGIELAIMAVGIALSLGGAAYSLYSSYKAAHSAVDVATKVQEASANAAKLSQITAYTNAAGAISTGAGTITGAVYDYEVAQNQAFVKEIEAILMRIQEADDRDSDLIKNITEVTNQLLESITAMINNTQQANVAIMTAAPNMA